MPPDARRSLRVYNLFFPFVFAALLPGFLLRLWRRGGHRGHFGQRLGLYTAAERAALAGPPPVWIHSISVGETLLALKLAREWHRQYPEERLLLSTTTTTGFALAQEHAAPWLLPLYNPLDFRPIVRRTLRLLRPRQVILIEGEAWPNLLAECHRLGLPVALANARLSPRSERRFRRARRWTGPIFRLLECILVPEAEDLARWQSLGLPADKLRHTGSIKFDQPGDPPARTGELRALLSAWGFPAGAPVLLAGSTHAGEELLLAEMLPALRRAVPGLVLLIVPRHVERTAALLRELAPTGLRVACRTAVPDGSRPDLLLIDTTGELRAWYPLATVVFVGKSLTATGGQNPVEPALLGCPVLFGPHMENFATIVPHLLTHRAALQVGDAAELQREVERLLQDEAARAALVERARAALAGHQGATARAVAALHR